MPPLEVLGGIAATLTAVGIIGGALGWLVWPRIEDRFEDIARSIGRVEEQTGAANSATPPDSLAAHAKRAAQAASEIPQIREQLRRVGGDVERMAEKQNQLDAWQRATDARLLKLEEALIALMAGELRDRLRNGD